MTPYRALLHPRHWHSWLGLGVLRLIALLPMPLIALLGAGLGMLLYAGYVSRRRVVQRNIESCFPELTLAQQRRLARRHLRALGQAFLAVGVSWWASRWRLRHLVRWSGREHYEQAHATGRPIVFLVPHFVGIEIGGIRISIDVPAFDIFRHPDNEVVRVVMERARVRFGGQLIEHVRGLVPVIRTLKTGRALFYLPDQDPGQRSSSFVPFFGIQTATFNVLGRLAAITDAIVIPCFIHQRRFGLGYEIMLRPPLQDFPCGDILADTARMNAEIEAAVRQWPEQYFWVHKRFKTRPPGEANFYSRK